MDNRTSETVRESGLLGASDVTTTSSFNAADQLTARGEVTYSYDANGNQTGSSAGQALAYNAADQTTSLKRAGCHWHSSQVPGEPGASRTGCVNVSGYLGFRGGLHRQWGFLREVLRHAWCICLRLSLPLVRYQGNFQ